jgi:enoyl-CoA hydratase/carnithine racemase
MNGVAMSEHVRVTTSGGIMEVRLDRPERRNALTVAMYQGMADALAAAEADPSVRVVLLCGNGESFTAGNDLKDFSDPPPQTGERASSAFLRRISSASRVLVAAVQGHAVGVGTTMLLHCDFVVAAENARLHLPFVNLGLVPEAASSLLLPRAIGHKRAAEMFILGEPLDAATARDWGLVNRVVPLQDLATAARDLAAAIAARAPAAVRLTKALMKSATATVPERMAEEGVHFSAQLKSPEVKEAIAAFFEKRRPDFSAF